MTPESQQKAAVAFSQAVELLAEAHILLHHVTVSDEIRPHVEKLIRAIDRRFTEWGVTDPDARP